MLIRCDLNVPLDGETITDDGRIRASLPTLNELRDRGAKIIVMAHLGRPKGEFNPKYSLAPAAGGCLSCWIPRSGWRGCGGGVGPCVAGESRRWRRRDAGERSL